MSPGSRRTNGPRSSLKHAPELGDPHALPAVFAEIGRYHEAIVAALQTNTLTTVWQRLHDEQGLQASLRSFRRYVAHYLPEQTRQVQPTVRRDDPPPGREGQIDFRLPGVCGPIRRRARSARCGPLSLVLSYSRHMFVYIVTRIDPGRLAASPRGGLRLLWRAPASPGHRQPHAGGAAP